MDNEKTNFFEFVEKTDYEVPKKTVLVKVDEYYVKRIAYAMNISATAVVSKILKAYNDYFDAEIRKAYENGKGKMFQ